MLTCLLCLRPHERLTDEHIIPAALGGDLALPDATCKGCQETCNRSFETRFLKGSNFVALIRATLGIRGRRNEPVYGFDKHGAPLTIVPQAGFPPIRVGLGQQRIERPLQVVLMGENSRVLEYVFLPDTLKRPLTAALFTEVIPVLPNGVINAALWADGDVLPVNWWRELMEAFVAWAQSNDIAATVSTAATAAASVQIELDWDAEYRNRGLTKIALMYALYRMTSSNRVLPSLNRARDYVLKGTRYPDAYWKYSPVYQWNGPYPGSDIIGERPFSYFLATVSCGRSLIVLVRLSTMGLFAAKVADDCGEDLCPDTVSLYLLEPRGDGRYALREEMLSPTETRAFAASVNAAGVE